MMPKYDYGIPNQVYAMRVECVQKLYKPNQEKAYTGEERSEKDKEQPTPKIKVACGSVATSVAIQVAKLE